MGRFREIIRNGPIGRATQGNVWPLVAQTVGGAIGGPLLGHVAGNLVGRFQDRRDRRNVVPFSPSPDAATGPQQLRDSLGLPNYAGGSGASPPGRYGPLADGYAGLPAQPDPGPEASYDPDFTERLVQGYQNQPLMSAGYGPRTGNISQGGTRGFGVQSTTDIGGILDQLNFGGGNIGGQSGNYFDWLARNRPPVER